MQRASDQEIAAALATLPGWRLQAGTLARDFQFADFRAAFGFMTRVALLCERQDHHPDWTNSFNRLEIRLHSHDAGGITSRDFRLARAINEIQPG